VNARVLRLLIDYFLRTLGVWPLLLSVHAMQIIAFWATDLARVPLLGVVIASLTYFAAFESPVAVLKTLPLSRIDIALFRWWASIGLPGVALLACTSVSWLVTFDNSWPRPPQSDVTLYATVVWATLAWLAVLPLPERGRRFVFGFVWGTLGAVGFYGVPAHAVPRVVLMTLVVLGLALSVVAYVRAWQGKLTKLPLPDVFTRKPAGQSSRAGHLKGWSVIAADVARSTAILSAVALAGASIARWLYPILDGPVPLVWVFVSCVAVAACLQMRRWMQAVAPLRALPIGRHRLTLIVYAVLIVPGVTACTISSVVHWLVPQLGITVPPYMLMVFLATPAVVFPWQHQRQMASQAAYGVQRWAPLMQLAAWPLWAGALFSFGGPHLMPAWFLTVLLIFAAAFIAASYGVLLVSINQPIPMRRA
jgi:hypothetical protein